jgi:hypothetical protein
LKDIPEGREGVDISEYTIELAEDAGIVVKGEIVNDVDPK